jgi:hypothetical protein
MKALPPAVKKEVQQRLWRRADELDWPSISVIERAKHYGQWTSDPEIGGVLAAYMDPRRVRLYIKDTLIKPYARARLSDAARVLRSLGMSGKEEPVESFERPHGLRLSGDRVICWGKADDWKLILMAAHERAHAIHRTPFAAALLPPLTRFMSPASREVVNDAATKLGITHLIWIDPHEQLGHVQLAEATA